MVWMLRGWFHRNVSRGDSSARSAAQALGAWYGRAYPFCTLFAVYVYNGSAKLIARFCPSGRRLGVQNSNASIPMPSGGVCTPVLETALFSAWNNDNTPVSLVPDK